MKPLNKENQTTKNKTNQKPKPKKKKTKSQIPIPERKNFKKIPFITLIYIILEMMLERNAAERPMLATRLLVLQGVRQRRQLSSHCRRQLQWF